MPDLILTTIVVIIISSICSCVEAALLSAPLTKIKGLADSSVPGAKTLLKIREKINRPLTAIVIINNIANIGGSILVGETAMSYFGNEWIGAFSVILTLLIIVFGEIIPKTLGEHYSINISLFFAVPILFFTRLFIPFVWLIEKILAKIISNRAEYKISKAEITNMAKLGQEEGSIRAEETDMIHGVFNLNEINAKSILTPRVAITSVAVNQTLESVKNQIINSQHSRIIAIGKNNDDIKGIILKDELLIEIIKGNKNKSLSEFLHEPQFVSEMTKLNSLLTHFKKSKQHIAIVVDEFGGISGIVTLEDVLEELTGEIIDETDKVTDMREFARKNKKV